MLLSYCFQQLLMPVGNWHAEAELGLCLYPYHSYQGLHD